MFQHFWLRTSICLVLGLHGIAGHAGLDDKMEIVPDQRKVESAVKSQPRSQPLKTNTVDLGQFIAIAGGTYQIGSPTHEPDRSFFDNEDLHEVDLSPYEIAETAVTQKAFALRMGYNPSKFQNQKDCLGSFEELEVKGKKVAVCADHPVENVNWDQANEFARLVSADDPEYVYGLPTEAQQEVAFRGGTKTGYVSGDSVTGIDDYKWNYANSGGRTHPVNSKRANGYGIRFSSVWEWSLDRYSTRYDKSQRKDPTGPPTGANRVFRGCCWSDGPKGGRSASRDCGDPSNRYVDGEIGFRLSRTPRK